VTAEVGASISIEGENTNIFADIADMALNDDQQAVFNAVISAIDDQSRRDRYFFVDAPEDWGKTFPTKRFVKF